MSDYLFYISFNTVSLKYGWLLSCLFLVSDIEISVFLSFVLDLSLFIIILTVYYDLLPSRDYVFPSVILLVSLLACLKFNSNILFYF